MSNFLHIPALHLSFCPDWIKKCQSFHVDKLSWTYPCLVSIYCAPFPTHIKFFQDLGRIDIPIQAWVCTGERRSWSWLCRNTWSLSIFGTDYYSPSLFCTNNIKLRDLKKEKQRNKDFDLLFKRIKTMSYVLLLQPVIFWIFQT